MRDYCTWPVAYVMWCYLVHAIMPYPHSLLGDRASKSARFCGERSSQKENYWNILKRNGYEHFLATVHMAERSSDLSEISATSGPSYGGLSKVETSWHHEQSVSPSAVSSVSNLKVTSRPRKSLVWEYFEYDEQLKKSLCQVLKSPTSSDSDRL